jgi:hypothetical protein
VHLGCKKHLLSFNTSFLGLRLDSVRYARHRSNPPRPFQTQIWSRSGPSRSGTTHLGSFEPSSASICPSRLRSAFFDLGQTHLGSLDLSRLPRSISAPLIYLGFLDLFSLSQTLLGPDLPSTAPSNSSTALICSISA